MTVAELPTLWNMMIWGFAATVAMTIVMQGAQGLGLSRLSLPFLLGTFFTGDRRRAVTIGFVSLRDRRLVVRLSLFSPVL